MGDFKTPIDPEGFADVIVEATKLNVPIYITENGQADNNDEKDTRR